MSILNLKSNASIVLSDTQILTNKNFILAMCSVTIFLESPEDGLSEQKHVVN
jgi:hypothetical protein